MALVTCMPRAVKLFTVSQVSAISSSKPAMNADLRFAQGIRSSVKTVHWIAFWPSSDFDAASAVFAFGAALEPVVQRPLTIVAGWCGQSVLAPAGLCGGARQCPPPGLNRWRHDGLIVRPVPGLADGGAGLLMSSSDRAGAIRRNQKERCAAVPP